MKYTLLEKKKIASSRLADPGSPRIIGRLSALSGKNKRQLKDSEAVLMLEHSVTKDTVALEADTVELFLFQDRVVEILVDMGKLEAEKTG